MIELNILNWTKLEMKQGKEKLETNNWNENKEGGEEQYRRKRKNYIENTKDEIIIGKTKLAEAIFKSHNRYTGFWTEKTLATGTGKEIWKNVNSAKIKRR